MEAPEFLDAFVRTHVHAIPRSMQKQVATKSYIPVAEATAGRMGITRRELDAAAGGNLQRYFENQMEDKRDEEVRKNKPR
jgi:acetyl-CoA acetyltransferase